MKHTSTTKKLLVLSVCVFSVVQAFAWKPIIIGHRGSRTGVENTEEAFINGIVKHGLQGLECDVKVTKDKQYVCWHDDIITKCSPNCTIYTSTLATLQSKTLTQTRNGVTYTGKICTVDRYLEICKQYNVIPVVELKYAVGITGSDMSNFPGLYALIEKHGLVDKTIILTSMKSALQYVRKNYPRLTCQYLVNYITSDNIAWCKSNGCNPSGYYFYNSSNYLTQALVDEAHNGGMHVGAFTMNSTDDFKKYCAYGVNYLTSDDFVRKDLPELSGTDPNVPTTYKTIYYRPSTTNFANGYTDYDNKRADGGSAEGYQNVYWSKNSRLTASVHGNLKGAIFLDYAKTKTNDDLNTSRFMEIKVPTGYTGLIVHRTGSCTETNYNVWKHSAGATGISSVSVHNTVPRWSNSTTHIPAPLTIPTDGKNLLVNKEGWWDVWYWAYYLPKSNTVTMYFANTSDWKDVQLLTGKDIYTHATTPTKTIPGTKLAYFALNGKEFGYTHYGFIGNGANWDNSKTIPAVGGTASGWVYDESSSFANNKTATAKNSNANQNRIANRIAYASSYTGLLENLLSGANLYIPGSKGAKPTHKTIASYTNLNHTQTFVAETGGKVACSTYKLTGAGTSAAVNTAATAGTSTAVAAYTATTTLTVTPDAGYSFEGWYDGNTLVSNSLTYTYTTPNSAKTLTAKFIKGAKKDVRAQTYIYDETKAKWAWVNSNAGGSFTMTHSGGTVYTHTIDGYMKDIEMTLDPVTFQAMANDGYEFIGWWNNPIVYTANPWTMESPANYEESVTARFAKLSGINILVERSKGGKISMTYDDGFGQKCDTISDGSYKTMVGSNVTLIALSDAGCTFEGWYENDVLVSADTAYTYLATGDIKTLAARFKFSVKKDVRAQTYTYDAENATWGWIDSNEGGTFTITHSGGAVYTHEVTGYERGLMITSDPATFLATPNSGYEFVGWYNNLKGVFTDNPWTMERPEEYDQSVTARFAQMNKLDVCVENALGGKIGVTCNNGRGVNTDTVMIGDYYTLINSDVVLEAIADDKYTFDGWYEGATLISSESTYTYTVDGTNRNIVARFYTMTTPTYLDAYRTSDSDVYKLFINGQIYLYNKGSLYTIMGQEL